jgi:AraC-like DNA-binding protein
LPTAITARVRQVVNESSDVQVMHSIQAATDAVREMLGSCLLITVPGDAELDRMAAYQRFRGLYPNVPVVALFIQGVSSHRGTMVLGRVGVTDLVSVEGELDAEVLRRALTRAHASGVSHRVWDECRPRLPDTLVTLLKTALRIAHQPITAHALAAAAGIPERSLRKLCEDAAIPSPQWIIGWARLLVAAYYLDEPGRTILQVAELLQFTSSCALRNQLRRYTGWSPRELRAQGSTVVLCRAVERAAEQHRLHAPSIVAVVPLRLMR